MEPYTGEGESKPESVGGGGGGVQKLVSHAMVKLFYLPQSSNLHPLKSVLVHLVRVHQF